VDVVVLGTDQGKVSGILGAIFGIKTGFHGKIVSNLARVRLRVSGCGLLGSDRAWYPCLCRWR
jgi:hypothetical protein